MWCGPGAVLFPSGLPTKIGGTPMGYVNPSLLVGQASMGSLCKSKPPQSKVILLGLSVDRATGYGNLPRIRSLLQGQPLAI